MLKSVTVLNIEGFPPFAGIRTRIFVAEKMKNYVIIQFIHVYKDRNSSTAITIKTSIFINVYVVLYVYICLEMV